MLNWIMQWLGLDSIRKDMNELIERVQRMEDARKLFEESVLEVQRRTNGFAQYGLRLQALEDTVRDHVTQLFEANRYANELFERTLKIAELEDSRKAQWDALIELERKVTTERERILALERKAEDSGRIQAGGGVNRMRALISEQGGVKDGMLPTGVIR